MIDLGKYAEMRNEIFNYFGYVEDWRILPFDDSTEYFWSVDEDGTGGGSVAFGEKEDVETLSGNHYENEIYTQRHLPKWIYRAEQHTMIVVDTHTDGNQLLQIFDNAKEIK